MSHSALWDRFVASGVELSSALERVVAELVRGALEGDELRQELATHALACFQVGYQALLLGAEEIGKLSLACERACDLLSANALPVDGIPVLGASANTLANAFHQLANPDLSGARTEGLPLAGATYELETLFPVPGSVAAGAPDVPLAALRRKPEPAAGSDAASELGAEQDTERETSADPKDAAAECWVPTVDADMIGLFFEEARERLEELSVKLLDIEQRPDDIELLRGIFRDLHTVKGSAAMVGLQPANRLAHAAEDLVGQLREGDRAADSNVVDALLLTLDGLREIIRQAQLGVPLTFEFGPIVERLKDPASRAPSPEHNHDASDDTVGTTDAPVPTTAPQPRASRQTIRVDFDKLDKLMNLVGELVLGRDGLRSALQSLSAVSGELSGDRQLTRKIVNARRAISQGGQWQAGTVRDSLTSLGDELGRVERVLVDISQDLDYATGRLDSVSDDLRDQVMKLRMVPLGGVFRKHHRTVRDLANSLGKSCQLILGGEETELDKLLVETLDEPLMHLVRNAVDHGIELPEQRAAAGKPAQGTIHLVASHRGNQMVIKISDDGKGMDPGALRQRAAARDLLTAAELAAADDKQILELIFRPGFSTAAKVTEVSGRGVGMDVVKQTIVTRLKGTIEIDSKLGVGSTLTLRLPLTLAIIQVLLARTGGEVYAIPLATVVRTFGYRNDDVQLIQDREVVGVNGRQVPLIRLAQVLELEVDPYAAEDLQVILVEVGDELYGLACEHLLGKKEIVIKSLGDLLQNVPCTAGATLLGERCALILDVPAIVERALARSAAPAAKPRRRSSDETEVADNAAHVLLVEDSDTVRESLRRLLVQAGYRVTVAIDGVEGLEQTRHTQFDLVSTDVMMPRMDGYELTRALRATQAYRDTPIVMVTSRGERIDRVRGFDAGVDEYITKPHDRALLIQVVRRLLGEKASS